jgi:hypothetical protein
MASISYSSRSYYSTSARPFVSTSNPKPESSLPSIQELARVNVSTSDPKPESSPPSIRELARAKALQILVGNSSTNQVEVMVLFLKNKIFIML